MRSPDCFLKAYIAHPQQYIFFTQLANCFWFIDEVHFHLSLICWPSMPFFCRDSPCYWQWYWKPLGLIDMMIAMMIILLRQLHSWKMQFTHLHMSLVILLMDPENDLWNTRNDDKVESSNTKCFNWQCCNLGSIISLSCILCFFCFKFFSFSNQTNR